MFNLFFISVSKSRVVESWSRSIGVYVNVLRTPIVLQNGCAILHSAVFKMLTIAVGMKSYIMVVLVCISLMSNDS